MTDDDTMAFVQALVRLWDHEHRGYLVEEIATEAGWVVVPEDLHRDSPPTRYHLALVSTLSDGMVTYEWGEGPAGREWLTRLRLKPVLG